MLSAFKLRRARLEDSTAAGEMARLSHQRHMLRGQLIDAKEAGDAERERELVARCRVVDADYTAAADRRRVARRQLIDHHREERRA